MKKCDIWKLIFVYSYLVMIILGVLLYKNGKDTQVEWKKIIVKQREHIKKLAEKNKAQDVIINKLNAEYYLKHRNK